MWVFMWAVECGRCSYEEDWWLAQLAARNTTAIWARSKYPHNYEITAVEASAWPSYSEKISINVTFGVHLSWVAEWRQAFASYMEWKIFLNLCL
jgi:hypothetical protein